MWLGELEKVKGGRAMIRNGWKPPRVTDTQSTARSLNAHHQLNFKEIRNAKSKDPETASLRVRD